MNFMPRDALAGSRQGQREGLPILRFADSRCEPAEFVWAGAGGEFAADLYWTADAVAGQVQWRLGLMGREATATAEAPEWAGQVQKTTIRLFAEDGLGKLTLGREIASPMDTMAGDAQVFALVLRGPD